MARIVIEDIRLKKGEKKIISPPKKVVFSREPVVEKDNYYKEEKEEEKKEVEKSESEKPARPHEGAGGESKIDEYFKSILREKEKPQKLQRTPQIKTKSRVLSKSTIIFFIIAVILSTIYWSGNIFKKADITITSKHQLISYNNKQFLASKDPSSKAIDFEIMITSDKKTKNITLTESEDISVKAQGSITLYNEFSTTSQKISTGTFLSDSAGKSYKTDSAVTIPGYKIVNKKITPGQVVVNISAFLPGDTYNGFPEDFHVTSFKGTTKYNRIYGKLKSPLVGGALGFIYTLNDSNKSNIDNIAQTSFKEDLLKKVKALVPPGYILYPNAFTFSYKIGDNVLSKTPETGIELEGELSAVLLNEKSLVDNILKVSLPDTKENELKEIKIPDLSTLSFSFLNKEQLINKEITSVSFLLNGSVNAIWIPDIKTLKTKLLGINKNEVLSIFRQDPGIAGAIIKLFPPWQKYIPDDINKINIELK